MTAEIGSIRGPRVRTTRPRIDFWHGIPAEARWDSMWELIQQRQHWVRSQYGEAAFEDKPLYDGYSQFDLTDGGQTLETYRKQLLAPRDEQKLSFLLTQQASEHDEHHYVRLRPFCPKCRGHKVIAGLSLASWLVRHPGQLPRETSDDELGWDTEQVEEPPVQKQSELYLSFDQLGAMRPPNDLVEGIIPTRGVGYITGRDRSLKTFLALDICLHVAFMLPYWHCAGASTGNQIEDRGRRKVGFRGEGKILFAAGEGVTSFRPRIDAWIEGQHVKSYGQEDILTDDGQQALRANGCAKCAGELDPTVGHVHHLEFVDDQTEQFVIRPGIGELEKKNIAVRRGTPNFFAGGEDYRFMLAHARRERPDIIVIDTLALASGGADQQSNSEMGQVHVRAAALAEASGGVVLIIAHTDKGDNDARGASTIEDNADFVIHCNRVDNDQLEVTVAKRKDAEDNWKFHLGVTPVDLGFEQSSLILHDFDGELGGGLSDEEDQFERELIDIAERVVCDKGVNDFTSVEFSSEFGGKASAKTIRRHLDRLVASGDLQRIDGRPGPGGSTRYYFPSDWVAHQKTLGREFKSPGDQ